MLSLPQTRSPHTPRFFESGLCYANMKRILNSNPILTVVDNYANNAPSQRLSYPLQASDPCINF